MFEDAEWSAQEDEIEKRVRCRVRERLGQLDGISDEELLDLIRNEISKEGKREIIPLQVRKGVLYHIFNSLRKLDVLQKYIEDDDISEIMVNGYNHIFLEKDGKVFEAMSHFASEEIYEDVLQRIVGARNKIVNETMPIVDTRLEDGSRVNIVLRPIAVDGSLLTIRKFPKEPIEMETLIRYGTLNDEVADFLRKLVVSKYNIFVSGGTSSGKTTFLNCLTEFIPENERVVTMEDSAELQIRGVKNLVRMESRDRNLSGKNAIPIRNLVKTALRMRPDRMIVGECRGEETLEMLQAFNTGHDGGMSTGHGNSTEDMISRLESMSLMAEDLPLDVIRNQIASGIDIMIHLEKLANGARKVSEISEIRGVVDGKVAIERLIVYEEEKDDWNWVGRLQNTLKLKKAGEELG
jgi:pilus assembly protein CpaF